MNHSNFTYREEPLRADPRSRPNISSIPESQQPFSHVQYNPESAIPKIAHGQFIPPVATGSRILPSQVYVQPAQNVVVRDVRPVIASQVIEERSGSIPVSSIVQPISIPHASQASRSISRETKNLQPTYEYDTKYEYHDEPQVEIVRGSAWEGYYNQSKSIPPPPVESAQKEKTSCSPVLLAILGLLALAGLITGIVLAAKASGGAGAGSEGQEGTPGTPSNTIDYPNSSIIIETTIINSTSANSNNTNNNQTIQPIPIQPNQTSPIITNPTASPVISNPIFDSSTTNVISTGPKTTTITQDPPASSRSESTPTTTAPSESGGNIADLYNYDPNSYRGQPASQQRESEMTIQSHKLRKFNE